jgi:two-component system sensor histidine kinase/response regulator
MSPSPAVLVVEDEFDLLQLLLELLARAGYRASGVACGVEALAHIERSPPDLLVTDVGLPDVDGMEITRRVKSNPSTHHIPVLVVSGHVNAFASPAAVAESGADAFLPKPLDLGEFESTIVALLSGLPARGQLPARAPPDSR